MRPLTVLTGILLGSAAATTFGLAATLVIYLVLSGETPQLRAEFPLLLRYFAVFAALTALAACGFVGLLRERPWRWWAQGAMWGTLAVLAALYASTRG